MKLTSSSENSSIQNSLQQEQDFMKCHNYKYLDVSGASEENKMDSNSNLHSFTKVIFIEPFYSGSHKAFLDIIRESLFSHNSELFTLDHKKWHWKMRTSSLYFSQTIPKYERLDAMVVSSVLNLTELIGLRPDFQKVHKIIYFHENQLNYPTKESKGFKGKNKEKKDFHYGWIQILSCITADSIYFNSKYNYDSFLQKIPSFLHKVPNISFDQNFILDNIKSKSNILYFPIQMPASHLRINLSQCVTEANETNKSKKITILWNHRIEHDKDPTSFFSTLLMLMEKTQNFQVIVLGEESTENLDPIIQEAKEKLQQQQMLVKWGFVQSKQEYYQYLNQSDIVVSTSLHEFFGVSIIEAILCGCFPICPNRLVYPEYLPKNHLYNTPKQLFKMLKDLIIFRPEKLQDKNILYKNFDFQSLLWNNLRHKYFEAFLPKKTKVKTE